MIDLVYDVLTYVRRDLAHRVSHVLLSIALDSIFQKIKINSNLESYRKVPISTRYDEIWLFSMDTGNALLNVCK